LPVAGAKTLEREGIEGPESERMPVDEHEGRLGAIGHRPSLHRRVAHNL
jgi:hypothetical protein